MDALLYPLSNHGVITYLGLRPVLEGFVAMARAKQEVKSVGRYRDYNITFSISPREC